MKDATLRLTIVLLALGGLLLAAPVAGAQPGFDEDPVLFVHGFSGSGAQFESQKMRFMSNGYPEQWVDAIDYDSPRAAGDRSEVHAQIDAAIAELQRRTGRSEVDVVAHSLGTSVMHDYLAEGPMAAQRKAEVDRYVNVDGQTSNPGVPTLAVFAGRGEPGRSMDGATNVTIPNQTHVQSVTSAESFVEFFKFLAGRTPAHDIVPERGEISIAGKALLFPQNKGAPAGITVEIWPVASATGQRVGSSPVASIPLDESGDFGPVRVRTGQRYEFVLVRPGVARLHYYYEPFVRSDHLIRLPYSDAVEALAQRGERHVSGLVLRYKELWGDQGAQNDVLTLNGTNVCNAAICPIEDEINALFFFDRGMDGRTDLSRPDPAFSRLPFISAADIFLPAARPPTGTTTVSLQSRGGGPKRTLAFPNFPSTTDGAVLQFNDFEQPTSSGQGGGRRCFTAASRARKKRIGRAGLGNRRSNVRRTFAAKGGYRRFMDRYCLADDSTIRVGYPSHKQLRRLVRRERRRLRAKASLVLTTSRRSTVRGINVGDTRRELLRKTGRRRGVRVGKNVWYVRRGQRAGHVFKVRGGIVREVGIADRKQTATNRRVRRFFTSDR